MHRKISFSSLLKKDIFLAYSNPATYVAIAFFLASNAIHFFYINQFFVYPIGSSDIRFFFNFFPFSFILVIPLLTMNLWPLYERESMLPTSLVNLIISKWLSTVGIVVVTVFLCLPLLFVVSLYGDIELGVLFSSIIGIIFLVSSLCAFGQLCSVIFSNNAVSFFVTTFSLVLFTLNGIIANGSYINNSFITTIARFFSYTNHFEAFSKGIIDTRSIFFFVCITLLCLLVSLYILERNKYGVQNNSKRKRYIYKFFFAGCLLISLLVWNTQLYYGRIDISESKKFSISDYTKTVIDSLDSTLSITYYVTPELSTAYPQSRNIEDFLYEYSNYSNKIQVHIDHPESEQEKTSLSNIGVTQIDIPSIQENRTSIIKAYSAIVLEYKNNIEIIPFLIDTASLEYDIIGRMQSLTSTLFRSVFILVGNGLSLHSDYPFVIPFLESAGYSVRELSKEEILETSNLDTRTPLIVLGSSALQNEHVSALESFISIGAKVFFSVSPISIDLDTWESQYNSDTVEPVFTLLSQYGITILPSLIHDTNVQSTKLLSENGETLEMLYPFFITIPTVQANTKEVLGSSFKGLSLLWPNVTTIDTNNNNTVSIAHTSENSWLQNANELLFEQTGEAFITNPFYENNTNSNDSVKTIHTIASTYSNNIVVVSDQYFLSRGLSYIQQDYIFNNFDFLINALLWLQGDFELINIKSKSFFNYSLYKITDQSLFRIVQRNSILLLSVWYIFICVSPFLIICVKRKKTSKIFLKRTQ